jgi:hypothetical protein
MLLIDMRKKMQEEDTEGNYRHYLALLVNSNKSRVGTEDQKQFMSQCRAEAAEAFPKGAAAARRKDMASEGIFADLGTR